MYKAFDSQFFKVCEFEYTKHTIWLDPKSPFKERGSKDELESLFLLDKLSPEPSIVWVTYSRGLWVDRPSSHSIWRFVPVGHIPLQALSLRGVRPQRARLLNTIRIIQHFCFYWSPHRPGTCWFWTFRHADVPLFSDRHILLCVFAKPSITHIHYYLILCLRVLGFHVFWYLHDVLMVVCACMPVCVRVWSYCNK